MNINVEKLIGVLKAMAEDTESKWKSEKDEHRAYAYYTELNRIKQIICMVGHPIYLDAVATRYGISD